MPVGFVILFEGRCGSTHLTRLLDAHPRIRARPEMLSRIKNNGGGPKKQLRWARRHLVPPPDGSVDAIGFKTKLRDVIDVPGFASVLMGCNARVIHLERENLVKLAVSSINAGRLAKATNRYNLFDEADRLPPLHIDIDEFIWNLEQRGAWQEDLRQFLSRLDQPSLRVSYESLLRDESAVLEQVFAFLGVDPFPVSSDVLKNTSDNLRDAITNFEELRTHFVGTRYEPMFDEVIASR